MSTIGFILGIIVGVLWLIVIVGTWLDDHCRLRTDEPRFWVFLSLALTAWIWMSWLFVGLGMIPWPRVLPSDTFERSVTHFDPNGAPRQKHRPGVE